MAKINDIKFKAAKKLIREGETVGYACEKVGLRPSTFYLRQKKSGRQILPKRKQTAATKAPKPVASDPNKIMVLIGSPKQISDFLTKQGSELC